MKAYVQIRRLGKPRQIKVLDYEEKSEWVAGRRSRYDIYTGSKYASRTHFSILYKDGNFFIYDHGAANGTSVNDVILTPKREYPLNFNDEINVGATPSSLEESDRDIFIFEICKKKRKKAGESSRGILSNVLKAKRKKEDIPGAKEDSYSCNMKEENVSVSAAVNGDISQNPTDIDNIYPIDKFEKCSEVCLIETEMANVSKTGPERSPEEIQTSFQSNLKVADIQCNVQVKQEVPDSVDCTINGDSTIMIKKEIESSDNCSSSDGPPENRFGSIGENMSDTKKSVINEVIFEDPLPESEIEILYSHTYSKNGDFIKISDSNNTYQCLGIKTEVGDGECTVKVEEDEDSDDVVFIDSIIKNKKSNFDNITEIKIEDDEDFTETDRKWINKLLNIKEECKSVTEDHEERGNKAKEEEDESWIEHVMLCAEDINRILEYEEKKAYQSCDEDNRENVGEEDIIEIDDDDDDDDACRGIQTVTEKQKELSDASTCDTVRKRPAAENSGEIDEVPAKKIKIEAEGIERVFERKKKEEKKTGRHFDETNKNTVGAKDPIEPNEGCETIQTVTEKQKEVKACTEKKPKESSVSRHPKRNLPKTAPREVAPRNRNRNKLLPNGVPCSLSKAARKAAKRRRAKERKRERARLAAIRPPPCKRRISKSSVELKVGNQSSGKTVSNNEENKSKAAPKLNEGRKGIQKARQENEKPLKSSMKKFGCAFMRSNRPLAAEKTVTFGANQTKIYETENRISKVTSYLKLRKSFLQKNSLLRTISQICSWEVVWLEESKRAGSNELPEYFQTSKLKRVEKRYKNHSDYVDTFIPLILLDMWYTISEKWQKFGNRMCQMSVLCKSYAPIPQTPLGVIGCACIDFPEMPKEGDLVIIHLGNVNIYPGDPRCRGGNMLLFGYIHTKNVEEVDRDRFRRGLDGSVCRRRTMRLIKLNILVVQNRCLPLYVDQVIQITLLHNASLELFACQAILDLFKSPLCSSILGPNIIDMNFKGLLLPAEMSFWGALDLEQRLLITQIVSCCDNTSCGLMLIQGGAGTGKTHVTKALILQLLSSSVSKTAKPPKILYCSHSCVVVDEMALKLDNYRRNVGFNGRYKLVRFCYLQDMNSTVPDKSPRQMTLNHKDYNRSGGRVETNVTSEKSVEDADIICITCAETESKTMSRAFERLKLKNPDQKVICIIDGAMESKEWECIMPLKLGVTHLILVGDPRQFQPKTKNEVSRSFGSHQSLFWRISSAFRTGEVRDSPVYVLKTQYRMSREIMKLISRIFYGCEFNSGYSDKLSRAFKEFLFFADDELQESIAEKGRNSRRIQMSMLILDALIILKSEKVRRDSIAVITCREDETKLLNYELGKRFSESVLREIEVNSIEKVQGREFDIVLFLYDVKMETYFRANVAMSRAKRSLFVLSSSPSYQNNKILKRLGQEARQLNAFHLIKPNTGIDEVKSIINFQ